MRGLTRMIVKTEIRFCGVGISTLTQLQYDKSYGDLVKKMVVENVAEEISEAEK